MSKGSKNKHIHVVILLICIFSTGATGTIYAQDTIPESVYSLKDSAAAAFESTFFQHEDSVFADFSDPSVSIITESDKTIVIKDADSFKPNPKTAWIMAAVFPGLGQVYNRQYWKLPIVYGGLMACAYATTWNNKTYQDYKQAYFDVIKDARDHPNPEDASLWSDSWQSYVPSSNDPSAIATRLRDRTFHENLRRRKDYFRRYRDLSLIIGIGVYVICIADSYVDAQMFDFDVSPDLSFRVTPEIRHEAISGTRSYGINVCMTF